MLGFATRQESPPSKETIGLLSGVIASSPLVRIARNQPSPPVLLFLKFLAKFFPHMALSTPIQVRVCASSLSSRSLFLRHSVDMNIRTSLGTQPSPSRL